MSPLESLDHNGSDIISLSKLGHIWNASFFFGSSEMLIPEAHPPRYEEAQVIWSHVKVETFEIISNQPPSD